jgi:hypothetical protein
MNALRISRYYRRQIRTEAEYYITVHQLCPDENQYRRHDYCEPPYPVLEQVNSEALRKSSHSLKITQRVGKSTPRLAAPYPRHGWRQKMATLKSIALASAKPAGSHAV